MSAAAGPVANPNGGTGGEDNNGQVANILQSLMRGVLMFTLVQYLTHRNDSPAEAPGRPVVPNDQQPMESVMGEDGKMKPLGVSIPSGGSAGGGRSGSNSNSNSKAAMMMPTACLWLPETKMSLHVYVSDMETIDPLHDCMEFRDTDRVLASWHESDLWLHNGDTPSKPTAANDNDGGGGEVFMGNNERHLNLTVPIPHSVQYNETHLYAHACLVRESSTAPATAADVLSKTFPLTRHRTRRRIRDEKNLLQSEDDDPMDDGGDEEGVGLLDLDGEGGERSPLTIASLNRTHDQTLLYLKPSLTLQLVNVYSMPKFPMRRSIPQQMQKHMDWQELGDDTLPGVSMFYPILYSSEFWITMDSMIPVNDTMATTTTTTTNTNSTHDPNTPTVSIEMHLQDITMWRWQFMSQMEESWRLQEDLEGVAGGGSSGGGMDLMRTMLLETNPILLIITAIVSAFHTLFDILAFKNDIKFFKGKKSMEGLSLRSMLVNTMTQVVILLYLMDNDTSFMVLMSNGVGMAIDCWKITKVVDVSLRRKKKSDDSDNHDGDSNGSNGGLLSGWEIQWEEKEGYKGSKTKEYDEIATSHLMFITMPLVTGYGIYSLLHQKHKGWYSWILNTLVGFIYMFGFVMMTPQLFINYKLQSVAHLNWRTLTYKSINTFIDDLFAFVIKMPIMHRLACLRDDVIFFIFCYQRYKYRTDFTRVNEFGQCEQPTEELLKEQRELEKEDAKEEKTIRDVAEGGDGTDNAAVEMPVPVVAEDRSDTVPVVGEGTVRIRRRRGARDKPNAGGS